MTNDLTSDLTCDFHGYALHVVEHRGSPYVPMRHLVEAMGLGWGTQQRKLTDDFRFGVTMIITASSGGDRETLCLALRKLQAWLMSIDTREVKPELADRIRLFQAECDDVLWRYWQNGIAVNRRKVTVIDKALDVQAISGIIKGVVRKATWGEPRGEPDAVSALIRERRQVVACLSVLDLCGAPPKGPRVTSYFTDHRYRRGTGRDVLRVFRVANKFLERHKP